MGVLGAIVAYHRDATRRAAEREMTTAKMPLGITAAEADAIVGDSPDNVSQTSGVLVTPVTMLAASNSKAADYGVPQNYTLRTWKRGYVNLTVAVDANGKVAGRWTWRQDASGVAQSGTGRDARAFRCAPEKDPIWHSLALTARGPSAHPQARRRVATDRTRPSR